MIIDLQLIHDVVERAPLASSLDHGVRHWKAVAATGLALAAKTPRADPELVLAFALFHDSQRLYEYHDPEHGARGARLAEELLDARLPDFVRGETLAYACLLHDDGLTSENATVGVCWDADRLQLPRVGVQVDPKYLSTSAAQTELFTCSLPDWMVEHEWVDLIDRAQTQLDRL